MKFFYFGANLHQQPLDLLDGAPEAVVLYEDEWSRGVKDSLERLKAVQRAYSLDRSAVESVIKSTPTVFADQRERIIQAVLKDYKVFLLRMRFLRVDVAGAFDGFGYFADTVDYAITLTRGVRPDLAFCAYTPHTPESWIVIRTLEELGARVVRLIVSPLPWVLLPVQGLTNAAGCNLTAPPRQTPKPAIAEYLDRLRRDYTVAMPYYERVLPRLSMANVTEFIKGLNPRDMARTLEKRAVRREFQAAATPLSDGEVFGVYFLHYQPEMNTLPEADLYCDQYQAVKKLSDALPDGMVLRVKEHPSTFSKRCDRRWRPAGYYERFLRLPNVKVCPSEVGTFDLIDRSAFVASIAGVCLTEALARGKAAVGFYSPRFAGCLEELVVDANELSASQLRARLSSIQAGSAEADFSTLESSLEALMRMGYDGALDHTYIPGSAAESYANSKRANCLAIQDLLAGAI
jgi:hypothetical protein